MADPREQALVAMGDELRRCRQQPDRHRGTADESAHHLRFQRSTRPYSFHSHSMMLPLASKVMPCGEVTTLSFQSSGLTLGVLVWPLVSLIPSMATVLPSLSSTEMRPS